jgi:PilZ domain-containing protein
MSDERRSKLRYPLDLAVRYQSIGPSRALAGVGRTLNLSSSGLLLESCDEVPTGARLRVTIEWPSLLNGTTPLQLVTVGRVVRQDNCNFAVVFEHYQFKTMSRNPLVMSAALTSAPECTTTSQEAHANVRPAQDIRNSSVRPAASELQKRAG